MAIKVLGWLCVAVVMGSASGEPVPKPLSDAEYLNKVRGAWLGKCIGGALGMPIEGWHYSKIDEKFPNLNGYTGYFQNAWTGWSGLLQSAEVPKEGEWRRVEFRVRVPGYDAGKVFPTPIIGLSPEFSFTPVKLEIRNVRIKSPRCDLAFGPETWDAMGFCAWQGKDAVKYDYPNDRAWLKLRAEAAKKLDLAPDAELVIAFEGKWTAEDNRLGLALDWLSNDLRKGFGPDDDTTYQIVGLHTLETSGPDLSCKQLGAAWCALLPEIDKGLAEGLALDRMRKGIEPPESGNHPIGEAIGGQMKAEIWGLICPGRPDLAAEYARRDGVVAT
jgi:hypothetical protein